MLDVEVRAHRLKPRRHEALNGLERGGLHEVHHDRGGKHSDLAAADMRRGVARAHHDLGRAGEARFQLLRKIQDQGTLLSGVGCLMNEKSRITRLCRRFTSSVSLELS